MRTRIAALGVVAACGGTKAKEVGRDAVVKGKAPAPIEAGAAIARIEQVAAEAGWPRNDPASGLVGLTGDDTGIQTYRAGDATGAVGWVGRIGQYTRRVWIRAE